MYHAAVEERLYVTVKYPASVADAPVRHSDRSVSLAVSYFGLYIILHCRVELVQERLDECQVPWFFGCISASLCVR